MRFWPRVSGWHRVEASGGDDEVWFYASSETSWAALRQEERRAATEAHALLDSRQPRLGSTLVVEPWPRWPWFALLIAALGYVWLVERRQV